MSDSGPLDLEPWRARLASKVPALRSVGLAADLAAARGSVRNPPQAFVVPVSDAPRQSPGTGNSVVSQNVGATFAVVLAVKNARGSDSGSGASEDVQVVRRQIVQALLGWKPPGASISIQYGGGQSVNFADATVWFSDRFTTAYFLRAAETTE